MKKMYEKTVRGYYVMSVVLGLLLALSVATMLEVAVLDAISAASGQMNAFWDDVWGYLPLNLCNYFWQPEISCRNLNILAVTASILTVGIFVRMSGTKGSRTKMLQAIATAILALLMMLAYAYATRGWIRNAALAIVPILLMVIPLTILRKAQQPVDGAKTSELAQGFGELRRALRAKDLRGKAMAFMDWWLDHKMLGYFVCVAVFLLLATLAGVISFFLWQPKH